MSVEKFSPVGITSAFQASRSNHAACSDSIEFLELPKVAPPEFAILHGTAEKNLAGILEQGLRCARSEHRTGCAQLFFELVRLPTESLAKSALLARTWAGLPSQGVILRFDSKPFEPTSLYTEALEHFSLGDDRRFTFSCNEIPELRPVEVIFYTRHPSLQACELCSQFAVKIRTEML